jgi:HEAT repeat protein
MRQGAWKISTFAAVGVAAFLALHPLGRPDAGDEKGAAAKTAHHHAAHHGGGLFAWLGVGAPSSDTAAPRTGTHLQRLRDARNPAEQCEALRVLALEATGDEEATDTIGDYASSAHPRAVRFCAVGALEKVRSGAARSYLSDLVEDSDRYIRASALRALASQARDDADARATVIAAAHSEDRDTRLEALIALGDAHVPDAAKLLEDAIATETGDTRARLIAALGETRDPSTVSAISQMADDGSASTRAAALEALGSIGGDAAIAVLEDKLKNGTHEDGETAARALATTGDPRAKQALLDAASNGTSLQQLAALHALVQVDGDDVRQTMLAGLHSKDPRLVTAGVGWFASHADKTAVPDLAAMLATAPAQAQGSIVSVLASIGGDDARAAIASAARGGGPAQVSALSNLANMPGGRDEARTIALGIVKGGGQNAGSAIAVLGQDASPKARDALVSVAHAGGSYAFEAMNMLAQRGDPDSMRALTDLSRSGKTPELRGQALTALGSSGDPKSTPVLLSAALDKDPAVRRAAVAALGRSQGQGAERALVAATGDDDEATRATAIRSLGMMHTESATRELERIANGQNDGDASSAFQALAYNAPDRAAAVADQAMSSGSSQLRQTVVDSAGTLPAPDARRILTSALHDANDGVASSAVNGLASLGGDAAQQSLLDLLTSDASQAVKRVAADALDRSGTDMAQQHADLIGRYKSAQATDNVEDTGEDEDLD